MNPRRTHDKDCFFKYMSAHTALAVLRNKTLRWSSPTEFNDPFDVPRELAYDISPGEIKSAICENLINIIRNPDMDLTHFSEKIRYVFEVVRKGPPDVQEEIEEMLRKEADAILDESKGLDGLRVMWRNFIPKFRILCLTTKHDSVSMWYHYADKYKGVVIEIACRDELDSAWLLARPVEYPEEPPPIFSSKGWAELIMMPIEHAFDRLIEGYTYTKTSDWRYEEEWRITSFKRLNETGAVSDYSTNSAHFTKVFLGPLIEPDKRAVILSLIKNTLPHTEAFDVGFGLHRKFTFQQIENN